MAEALKVRTRHRHEGTEAVSRERKVSGVGFSEEKNDVKKVPIDSLQDTPHVAKVRVEGSVTKNMGNFESIRVGVAIEWPCAPTAAELDKTYAFLSQRVDTLVQDELDAATR